MQTPARPPIVPPPLPGGISLRPSRVRWVLEDLLSRDGHRLSVVFSAIAKAIDEPAEVQMFTEAFSVSPRAGSKNAVDHFIPGLSSAGRELAAGDTAEHLVTQDARGRWIDALKVAANETGFSCGIQVQPPFEVEVTSPTLQKERLEQMQRTADQRRSESRAEQFSRAAELLRQWEALKSDVPDITPGKLLEQISPADRGQMLDTLLMAGANTQDRQKAADLWAVSGSTLIRLDETNQARLTPLPSALGPLRSVSAQNHKLLIGARSGVFVFDPSQLEKADAYAYAALKSEHGFTSVTRIASHIWACHREGGLVGWEVDKCDQPAVVFSIAGFGAEPKFLVPAGLFAAGNKLYRLTEDGPLPLSVAAGSAVVAILPLDSQMAIVEESGVIQLLDRNSWLKTGEINTGGRVSTAAVLPWLGSYRLLLGRLDGPVECIGLEDQLVTRFTASPGGIRAIQATASRVAVMSGDRQRIVVWNSWDGRVPLAEVHIPSLTQHRLADLSFA